MKPTRDPTRWSDPGSDGPEQLNAAIHALRARRGSSAQVEALAQRLAPQLATKVVAGTATSLALSSWLKLGGGLLLAAALGFYALGRPAPAAPARSAPATQQVQPAATQPALAMSRPPSLPVAARPAAQPEPEPAARTAVKPRPARASARTRVAPEPPAEPELVLLQRSQAALDRDPAAALAFAEQHARQHPTGAFAQEREILAIEALLKLRQPAAALARAERFVHAHPESPHSERVRALLARSRSLLSPAQAPTIDPGSDHP